jgi:superfamily II helicase
MFKNHIKQGQTFSDFVKTGEKEEIEAINKLSEQLQQAGFVSKVNEEKIAAQVNEVNLLVVSEMFCPDCHVNVAAFNYLSTKQAKIKLNIITRDYAREHLLSALHLTEIKIPLVVCLDENYQLMPTVLTENLFIERPKTVKEITDFDEIKNQYLAGDYLNDTLSEILSKL